VTRRRPTDTTALRRARQRRAAGSRLARPDASFDSSTPRQVDGAAGVGGVVEPAHLAQGAVVEGMWT